MFMTAVVHTSLFPTYLSGFLLFTCGFSYAMLETAMRTLHLFMKSRVTRIHKI